MHRLRRATPVVVVALVASLLGSASATAEAPCAGPSSGGEWPLYGHDLANSRTQPEEDLIDADRAAALVPKFVVSAARLGGSGFFNSTPVIAGGCLYAATDAGWVFGLNADDGSLAWKRQFEVAQTRLGA